MPGSTSHVTQARHAMTAQIFVSLVTLAVVLNVMLLVCAYLILLERKVAAWTQDRVGPNRTMFHFGQDNLLRKIPVVSIVTRHRLFGLGQALADGVKLFFKEDYTPPHVERWLFVLAPMLVMIPAMIGWAVIPWGGLYAFPGVEALGIEPALTSVAVAPISIGVVYILAIGSLAVYGVVLGGFASNNKFSFLGGVRATAQMVSYEVPMGLCVLVLLLTFRSTDASVITGMQALGGEGGIWGIFMHPMLAIIFFTCLLAEANRAPFDLAESEQDLVGGYHTEYGSMKWALFFLAEYMHMITGSAFFCILFLGGWDLLPFVAELPLVGGIGLVLLKALIFSVKVLILIFIMMWVRWTFPRFRFDQLMRLAWQGLIPITIAIMVCTGGIIFLGLEERWLNAVLFLLVNVGVTIAAAMIAPMLPKGPPINRRVPLAGSRFSPLPDATP